MKTIKIIFSALVISIFFIAVTFIGCTKEKDNSIAIEQENVFKYVQPMRALYQPSPGVYGCAEPPRNCLPTVIITSAQLKSTSKLDVAYNDFIDKFNKGKVNEFFTSGDYLSLFPQVNSLPNVLNELRNSDIKLYHQKNKQDGLDYYLGLPKNTNFKSDWIGLEKCVFVINHKK